jgi:hypothetical protein
MNTGVGKVDGGGDNSSPSQITNPAYSADE